MLILWSLIFQNWGCSGWGTGTLDTFLWMISQIILRWFPRWFLRWFPRSTEMISQINWDGLFMNTIGWCQLPLGWRVVSPLTEDSPSLQLILFYVHTFVLWGVSWCRQCNAGWLKMKIVKPQITPVTSSDKTSLNKLSAMTSGCNFTLS